jgi:uncharacterized membrane protein
MNKINWRSVAVLSVIVVVLIVVGSSLFGGWGYGPWGMMGPGMMGFGMLFMWLIPISFLVLIVFGIVWLVRTITEQDGSSPDLMCHNCGKAVQHDWHNCPYCGTGLTQK